MLRSLFDDQNNYFSFQLDFFKIFFIRLFSSSKRENNLLNSSEEPNKLDSVQLIVENLDIILKLLWAKTSRLKNLKYHQNESACKTTGRMIFMSKRPYFKTIKITLEKERKSMRVVKRLRWLNQVSFYVTRRNRKIKTKTNFPSWLFSSQILRQLDVININLAKRSVVFRILFSYAGGDTTTSIFKWILTVILCRRCR